MNTKITALFLAGVAALTVVPQQARAGDKEAALIGGFIGGLVVGAVINDNRPAYRETVVVHDGPGYRDNSCAPIVVEPAGYWDYRTVRTWVPGYWEFRWVRGCRERVYVAGYWSNRRERVWVASRGHGHDRGYDRDYDRRRGHDRW